MRSLRAVSRRGRRLRPLRASAWLLYGAYGYTGRLLASEAIRRGHRPILAGRNRARLEELRADLLQEADWPGREEGSPAPALALRAFPLQEREALARGLEGVRAVLHAAGPFVETGVPMMEGCLRAGADYLDITGEVPVFEAAFERDPRAREAGVRLMPGVGMDVVPTDGAAALLAAALPGAVRLELALHSPGRPSAGTVQTVLEGIPGGLLVRRAGRLVRRNPGRREFRRRVDFGPESGEGPMAGRLGGERAVAPYTWGDLATAWRTTGIDDITCYRATPAWQVRILPVALPVLRGLLSVPVLRRAGRRRVASGSAGPDQEARRTGRTRVWGRVEDDAGRAEEVVLELPEGYRFTAIAGVRALERLLGLGGELEGEPGESAARGGTLTPAGAFGFRWVLELPGVEVVRSTVPVPGEGSGARVAPG